MLLINIFPSITGTQSHAVQDSSRHSLGQKPIMYSELVFILFSIVLNPTNILKTKLDTFPRLIAPSIEVESPNASITSYRQHRAFFLTLFAIFQKESHFIRLKRIKALMRRCFSVAFFRRTLPWRQY